MIYYHLKAVGILFELRNSMKVPTDFKYSLRRIVILAVIVYITFPGFYYLALGDETKDLVIFNLPISNGFYLLVMALYAIVLSITYPLQLFPLWIWLNNNVFGKDVAKDAS